MHDGFERIREIAPSRDGSKAHLAIKSLLTELNAGTVSVETVCGTELGKVNLDGDQEVKVLVVRDGISRASGGELFMPVVILDNRGDL